MRESTKYRRRTAYAVSALVLALAATACGSSDSAAGGDTATGSSTYVFALPQDFQGVDRAAYSSEASKTIGDVMHGRLLELETDASSPTACKTDVPAAIGSSSALVDSWSVTPDGLGIDITLEPDVKSADGNVLTSDDVAWTIERAKAIDTGAQTLFFKVGGYDPDNTMTITSPTQFRFNLTAPNALAPYVLSSNIGLILDSTTLKQKATPDDPWAKTYLTDHTANFGPWQLSTFGPQQLTFTQNPNFTDERGNIDQIVLRTVSDASSRIQLIQSGQVSETIGLDYTQLEQLGSSSSVNIVECASPARDWLGLNSGDPVLGKPEVRQAISLALDRSAISDAVYRGFAEPTGHGLSNAFSPTSGDENYTQDQDKARELLAAAGVPDGFGFDLSVSAAQPGPYSSNLAVLIQQQLAEVGIAVNIVNVPSAVQFRSDGLAKSMQAWLLAETPAFANPGYSGWLTAGTAGLQNYMGYSNPEVDAITAELMADPTGPDSAAAQARLSDIVATDQPAVYLVDRPTISVRSACATEVPASAFGADYTQAVTSCR